MTLMMVNFLNEGFDVVDKAALLVIEITLGKSLFGDHECIDL